MAVQIFGSVYDPTRQFYMGDSHVGFSPVRQEVIDAKKIVVDYSNALVTRCDIVQLILLAEAIRDGDTDNIFPCFIRQ